MGRAWVLLVAVCVAQFAWAQTVSVAEFIELSSDDDALAEAIERMPLDERRALGDAVSDAFQESYRTALKLEMSVLELQRLKLLDGGATSPAGALVEEFFSLDPSSSEFSDFVEGLSLAERENLANDAGRQFDSNLRRAQQLELAAMEQELLVRRMSYSPITEADPQCDPGSICRLGCASRYASCARQVAQIASDCADDANERKKACRIGNLLNPEKCLGKHLQHLASCGVRGVTTARNAVWRLLIAAVAAQRMPTPGRLRGVGRRSTTLAWTLRCRALRCALSTA